MSVRSLREAALAKSRLEGPPRVELDEDRARAVIGGATLDCRGGGNHDVAVPKDDERTLGGVLGAGIGDEDPAVLRERGIQGPVGEQPGHHHVGKGIVPLVRTRRREDDAPVRHSRREQTSKCDQPSVDHAVRAEGRVKTAIREHADQPDARRAAVRIGNRRNEKLPVCESQRARITAAGDEVRHAGVRAAEVRVAASVRVKAERRGRTLAADKTGAEDDDSAVRPDRHVARARGPLGRGRAHEEAAIAETRVKVDGAREGLRREECEDESRRGNDAARFHRLIETGGAAGVAVSRRNAGAATRGGCPTRRPRDSSS